MTTGKQRNRILGNFYYPNVLRMAAGQRRFFWHPMRTAMFLRLSRTMPITQLARVMKTDENSLWVRAAQLNVELKLSRRRYQPWEFEFILKNYKKMTIPQMARRLKRTTASVQQTMWKKGIKTGPRVGASNPQTKFSDHDVFLARALYYEHGMSTAEIARKFECSAQCVRGWVSYAQRAYVTEETEAVRKARIKGFQGGKRGK